MTFHRNQRKNIASAKQEKMLFFYFVLYDYACLFYFIGACYFFNENIYWIRNLLEVKNTISSLTVDSKIVEQKQRVAWR